MNDNAAQHPLPRTAPRPRRLAFERRPLLVVQRGEVLLGDRLQQPVGGAPGQVDGGGQLGDPRRATLGTRHGLQQDESAFATDDTETDDETRSGRPCAAPADMEER